MYNLEEGAKEPVGGAPRFAGMLETLKPKNPLVAFGGDAFNPSMMSTLLKGKQMVPVLNKLNVNVATVVRNLGLKP